VTTKINGIPDAAKTSEQREIMHHHCMIMLIPQIAVHSNSFLVNNGEDLHSCMHNGGLERRMEKGERAREITEGLGLLCFAELQLVGILHSPTLKNKGYLVI